MSEDKAPKITRDVAIPIGHNAKGNLMVARVQGTDEKPLRSMVGEILPLVDGVPAMGEVVHLTPCGDASHYHVETIAEDPYREERTRAEGSRRSFGGTKKMRDNWDRIFGKKPDPFEVN